MKCILALLALSLVPTTFVGQQPPEHKASEAACANLFSYDSGFEAAKHCLDLQRQERKEAEEEALKVKESADAAKKAADDLRKLSSSDKDQQIDGAVGAIKDLNSHGNPHDASKAVTDDALDFMSQVAHQEKELLDNVGKNVEKISEPQAGSSSSFTAGSHQLNEPMGSTGQLTFEQQVERQQAILSASPSVVHAERNQDYTPTKSASQLSFEQQAERQEQKLLASPSTVSAVARGVRAQEAAEQAYRDQKAKEELAERVARAEAAKAERIARAERVRELEREDKRQVYAEQAEEERTEREYARAMKAYWSQFEVPTNTPSSPPFIPWWSSTISAGASTDTSPSSSSHSSCNPQPGDTTCK